MSTVLRYPFQPCVALLVFDQAGQLLYRNGEADRILEFARDGDFRKAVAPFLRGAAGDGAVTDGLVLGRRHYLCHFLRLHSNSHGMPITALLVERDPSPNLNLRCAVQQFHLTAREAQLLSPVVEGLTTKEIAQRMQISPNTVKAFLRLLMAKMGATTRLEIVRKVLTRAAVSGKMISLAPLLLPLMSLMADA